MPVKKIKIGQYLAKIWTERLVARLLWLTVYIQFITQSIASRQCLSYTHAWATQWLEVMTDIFMTPRSTVVTWPLTFRCRVLRRRCPNHLNYVANFC